MMDRRRLPGARRRPSRRGPRASVTVTTMRWAAAIVFIVFGIGKFVDHGAELASFRDYPLPAPEVLVYAVGVLEIAGGALLAAGRLVRLAALALAGDMVGAIVTSGLARGEIVSLTLAPALLVAMVVLTRSPPADRQPARRRTHR